MQSAAAYRVRQPREPQSRMRRRDRGRTSTRARGAVAVVTARSRPRPREQLRGRVEVGHSVARRDGCVPFTLGSALGTRVAARARGLIRRKATFVPRAVERDPVAASAALIFIRPLQHPIHLHAPWRMIAWQVLWVEVDRFRVAGTSTAACVLDEQALVARGVGDAGAFQGRGVAERVLSEECVRVSHLLCVAAECTDVGDCIHRVTRWRWWCCRR